MGRQGRIVIPAELRVALEVRDGDELAARVQDDTLILERPGAILARVQERFGHAVPQDVSLVDELLAERREEVRREASR
ncbi:MAG: AbrB/MazE/SpoVT family DNA-binding domain-containing protein [Candidatus Dormibacteria bacterium]